MPTDHARNARTVLESIDMFSAVRTATDAAICAHTHAMLEIAAQLERLADRRAAAPESPEAAYEALLGRYDCDN